MPWTLGHYALDLMLDLRENAFLFRLVIHSFEIRQLRSDLEKFAAFKSVQNDFNKQLITDFDEIEKYLSTESNIQKINRKTDKFEARINNLTELL